MSQVFNETKYPYSYEQTNLWCIMAENHDNDYVVPYEQNLNDLFEYLTQTFIQLACIHRFLVKPKYTSIKISNQAKFNSKTKWLILSCIND